MQLYKRLLLSYFPNQLSEDSINPASMFISFISSREFFSIVHKRLIENYKLNLFDLNIDTFDIKLWFGDDDSILSIKSIDTYYAYLTAASFNGYKFFNISNTSNAITLVSALFLEEVFTEKENQTFINCLYSIYLINFLFASQIKVFPNESQEADFNRFIEVFFSFYETISLQLNHKTPVKSFQDLKKRLMSQLEVFFLLFHHVKRLNSYFSYQSNKNDYFQRLFWDNPSSAQKVFLTTYHQTKHQTSLSQVEEAIFFDLSPADIYIKYLFLWNSPHDIVNNLISKMYDKKKLKKKLIWLIKSPSTLDEIIEYLLDHHKFKTWYFTGIRNLLDSIYDRLDDEEDEEMDHFNEMLSEIWDTDSSKLNNLKIPQRIKKESNLIEQMLNFYVTFTGWLSRDIADSFYLRLFKQDLLAKSQSFIAFDQETPDTIAFLNANQFFYSRNSHFYSYVHKAIRSWKEKFMVPWWQKIIDIKTNFFSYFMFYQTSLITLLQDLNPKVIKLYIKDKTLLNRFQSLYGNQISSMIKKPDDQFVSDFFSPFFKWFDNNSSIISSLQQSCSSSDIPRLKDSLYSLDQRIFREFLEIFPSTNFKTSFNEVTIIHILAIFRELLPWFMLLTQYFRVQQTKEKSTYDLDLLFFTLLREILAIPAKHSISLDTTIKTLIDKFTPALDTISSFDDNKDFLDLMRKNWKVFNKKLEKKKAGSSQWPIFTMEDLLRFRWTLKHITYYNKRFLIPS